MGIWHQLQEAERKAREAEAPAKSRVTRNVTQNVTQKSAKAENKALHDEPKRGRPKLDLSPDEMMERKRVQNRQRVRCYRERKKGS